MKRTLALLCLGLTVLSTALVPRAAHAQLTPTFTNIFDLSTTIGSGGEYIERVRSLSLRGGGVAFEASYYSPDDDESYTGIFSVSAGNLVVHATDHWSSIAPNGDSFSMVNLEGSQGGTVLFRGAYGSDYGLFLGNSSGSYTTFLATDPSGALAPDGNPFNSLITGTIHGNRIAYIGNYGGYTDQAVQVNDGGVTSTVANVGDGIPARSGDFVLGFFDLQVSDSAVAMVGTYDKSGTYANALFLHQGGSLQIAADTGDTLSNGQSLTYFYSSVLEGNNLSFIGRYTDSSGFMPVVNHGIYTYTGGSLTTVVDTQTFIAPDGNSFNSFYNLTASDNALAFAGSYQEDMKRGIFISSGGVVETLLKSGDSLFGSTLQYVDISANSLEGNTLAFQYWLADGRVGIATATLNAGSAAAPEPGTLFLLGLGGVVFFVKRRRK